MLAPLRQGSGFTGREVALLESAGLDRPQFRARIALVAFGRGHRRRSGDSGCCWLTTGDGQTKGREASLRQRLQGVSFACDCHENSLTVHCAAEVHSRDLGACHLNPGESHGFRFLPSSGSRGRCSLLARLWWMFTSKTSGSSSELLLPGSGRGSRFIPWQDEGCVRPETPFLRKRRRGFGLALQRLRPKKQLCSAEKTGSCQT